MLKPGTIWRRRGTQDRVRVVAVSLYSPLRKRLRASLVLVSYEPEQGDQKYSWTKKESEFIEAFEPVAAG